MSYQVSKYEVIKAVLKAEKYDDKKLVCKMMQIIRRAVRDEIEHNSYTEFYVFSEQEKKIFENVSYSCAISAQKNNK